MSKKKRGNVQHVYPDHESRTTQVAYKDRARFAAHPGAIAFIRDYIPGEFDGVATNIKLSDITHVYVKRLNAFQQSRIALTTEQRDVLAHRLQAQEEGS